MGVEVKIAPPGKECAVIDGYFYLARFHSGVTLKSSRIRTKKGRLTMRLEQLDALDNLLRIIDRSGLCRANGSAFPHQGPRSIAPPISTKKNRLADKRSRQHLHGGEVLAPGH